MDWHGWVALATLVIATTLFITKWLPVGVTALAIPVVLHATGVLPKASDALQGFASPAAVAIGAVFVLGTGLRESGVATLLARGIQAVAGRNEAVLCLLVMVATAALSAFMSNAAVVAMLLPVVLVLSRRSGVAASRLLMPMAFAAVLGGTVTMVGTAANILVADYITGPAAPAGLKPLEVFDFAPVGLAVTVAGILFLALIGRRMLSKAKRDDRRRKRLPEDVARSFNLAESLLMFGVKEASTAKGRTLGDLALPAAYGMNPLMVRRPGPMGDRWIPPDAGVVLQAGDRLYAQGAESSAWLLAESELLQFGLAGPRAVERILGRGTTLAEVAVPPRSAFIGKTLDHEDFTARFGLQVLAVWRADGAEVEEPLLHELEVGDNFLVSGPARAVHRLEAQADFTVLTDQSQVEDVTRAPLALSILLAALLPAVLLGTPLALSAMGGALLMVVTGCVTPPGLRRSVDWNVLALIVGTLPLGLALEQQGIAEIVASALVSVGSALSSVGVLGILFGLSAILAVLASNAAAALIVAPIAARAAAAAGVDPGTALLAVAYGCSCAFVLPFAQWNLMVAVPGGYRTRDYLRVGGWTTLVYAATAIALLALRAR
jgi:di/tricarboxylate transporter